MTLTGNIRKAAAYISRGGLSLAKNFVDIETINYRESLARKLNDLCYVEKIPINVSESRNGMYTAFHCAFSDIKRKNGDFLTVRIYYYYLARAIAEIICQKWEKNFARKVLKKEYGLNNRDIEGIMAKEWLSADMEKQEHLLGIRKHDLVKSILICLDHRKKINLEGFLNFRAGQYKREVRKQIAGAVNDYALEQEHNDFIRLLKRIYSSRHAVYAKIHLVIMSRGEVRMLDECGRNINPEFLKNLEMDEDLLVSSILQCSPRQLIVHPVSDQLGNIIKMMDEVFAGKLSYCTGCSLCKN